MDLDWKQADKRKTKPTRRKKIKLKEIALEKKGKA